MNDYRYVVFPAGIQPTQEEAALLHEMSDAMAVKWTVGVNRDTQWLSLAFEATAFDAASRRSRRFFRLIETWRNRGAEVVDRLSFVKDHAALQPVRPLAQIIDGRRAGEPSSFAAQIAAKEAAAREAVARSLLGVQRTLDRHESLRRFAARVPYLLIGLGATVTIAAGFYIASRLTDATTETRRQTTERVGENAMGEPLSR